VLVKGQIGDQPFQSSVLFFQLLDLAGRAEFLRGLLSQIIAGVTYTGFMYLLTRLFAEP
jgi:hypothetical protein